MENYFKKIFFSKTNNTMSQFLRYAVVGGIASLVDISVFSLGISLFRINHIVSNSMAFVFGLVVNYLLSREWVFNKKTHNVKRDFTLFSLIGFMGLILSNILMYGLVDTGLLYIMLASSNNNIVKTVAKLIVIFLVFLWNFIARKRIVFAV